MYLSILSSVRDQRKKELCSIGVKTYENIQDGVQSGRPRSACDVVRYKGSLKKLVELALAAASFSSSIASRRLTYHASCIEQCVRSIGVGCI